MNYKNHAAAPTGMKSDLKLQFQKNYFDHLQYSRKGQLIGRHVFESLKWASKVLNRDLLNGAKKSALDVGCAFGYGVNVLRSLGYDAWGTDISKYGLVQGKNRLNGNVFVVCDAQQNLPFTKRFDLVTCFEVLEHLENPSKALQNIFKASDGVVLCTTPNKTVEQIFKKITKGFDKTHISVKTPSEWEKLICKTLECGFVEIQCFVDSSFQVANASFYKSLKLPFGMETRILMTK
jgi:2-polyprenyl-3-methyl-5-hydroxy-6-metoxy-1,4-benzoquinol methylase